MNSDEQKFTDPTCGKVVHMPIEELLFAAGFGMYWSAVYEHFTWRRSAPPDHQ